MGLFEGAGKIRVRGDGSLEVSKDNGVTWTAVGGGAATVTTDATLTGNGSGGSPLGVNPVAARAPDWFGALKNFFQQQTGLSSLAWSAAIEEDFAKAGLGLSPLGCQFSGTNAAVAFTNLPGGVVKLLGPSAGAGYADWTDSPQSNAPWNILGNVRTKRWMTAYRLTVGTATAAASAISAGVAIGATYAGIGYAGAATNWQYVRGTSITNIADTGKAISVDATGATGYLTMLVGNFDLTNVAYCADAVNSLALTNVELLTNLPSTAAAPYLYNEAPGLASAVFLDKALICVEL